MDSTLTHRRSRVRRTLLGLTIKILRCPRRLIDDPFGLDLGIANDAAEVFLRFAARFLAVPAIRSSFIEVPHYILSLLKVSFINLKSDVG